MRIDSMKAVRRQIARTAGGQDLWPRPSEAHQLMRHPAFSTKEWRKESIRRGLGLVLSGPKRKLP